MSNFLNTGLGFWEIIGVIVTLVVSVIAIKITFSFDLNKYLERKDKKNELKLKNACPHISIEPGKKEGDKRQYKVQSLFESPAGTLQWQCQKCGLIRNHNNDYDERAQYYADNYGQYVEDMKKFRKLLKKSGAI